MVGLRKVFALIVALSGCDDLLGIDDFSPPGEREIPGDLDAPPGSGGGGGVGTAPAPGLVWWRAVGGDADDQLAAIAVDDAGPLVGGVSNGALFVQRFDAEGAPGTTIVSQGPGSVERALTAIGPDGSIVVAASYGAGAITIAGSLLPDPTPRMGLAVVALEAGGRVRFAVQMSSDALEPRALAIASGGAVAVGGSKRGSFIAGTTTLPGGSDDDAMLVLLSAQGDVVFARDYRAAGDAEGQTVAAVRFDARDNLHVVGAFSGDLALGSAVSSRGPRDAFVATVDGRGVASLAAQLGGGSASLEGRAIAFFESGVVLAATADGDFDDAIPAHGETDIVVAALQNGAEEPDWAVRLGGTGPDFAHAIDRAADGRIFVGGSFSADFALAEGDTPLTSAGEQDALVFALTARGTLLWAMAFGRHDDDAVRALAVRDAGELWFAGSFRDAVELDGQVVHAAGGEDGIVGLLSVSE